MPSLARSLPKPLKVPSLARSVPKPLRVTSLARSVPKPLKFLVLHVLRQSKEKEKEEKKKKKKKRKRKRKENVKKKEKKEAKSEKGITPTVAFSSHLRGPRPEPACIDGWMGDGRAGEVEKNHVF